MALWDKFTKLVSITFRLPDTMHSIIFQRYGKSKAAILAPFSELVPSAKFTVEFQAQANHYLFKKLLPSKLWSETCAGYRTILAFQYTIQTFMRRPEASDDSLKSDIMRLGAPAETFPRWRRY